MILENALEVSCYCT